MDKPVIGIIARHSKKLSIRPNTYIRDEIRTAVLANGGLPIAILSQNSKILTNDDDINGHSITDVVNLVGKQEKADLISCINMCNGIILQGGLVSDTFEPWIAHYCYENDIPLLAICAGQNNLVRGNGGSIKNVPNKDKHNQPDQTYVHEIKIDKGSKFYSIVKTSSLMVNSRHTNVVENPGVFKVSAYDDDGNIEVIEATEKTFCIGTRYHPESLYNIDKKQNAIFKQFIQACKSKMN